MIDTHTHIVSPDEDRYPLSPRSLSGEWYKDSPQSAEDLLRCMDACGVEQAVLVQGVGAYSYDNSYAADSAMAWSSRFVSAACIDAEASDADSRLRYWVEERGMRGVRLFALSRTQETWLDAPSTFPVWEEAAALGVHVIVTVLPHQLPQLRSVLERFPDIDVSLDHCGFPNLEAPPWNEAKPLFELACFANLFFKITTNVIDSAVRGGAEPNQFVDRMAAVFGADRLMWGSDFCQTHDRDYRQLVELGISAFAGLTEDDRRACFVETPRRLWPALRLTEDQSATPALRVPGASR